MFDAFAEAQVAAESSSNPLFSLLPLLLIFIIFFFLVIRPQHKRVKVHNQMLESLKKGDKVVSSSGIIGIINKIDVANSIISLEISKGVEIKITKTSIADKFGSNDGVVGNNKSSSVKEEKDVTEVRKEEND